MSTETQPEWPHSNGLLPPSPRPSAGEPLFWERAEAYRRLLNQWAGAWFAFLGSFTVSVLVVSTVIRAVT